MKVIRRFFRQALVSYKSVFGVMDLKMYILSKMVTPMVSFLFFAMLSMHAYGKENMTPWIIGNAFVSCVFPAFLGAGLILSFERWFGTLKALIATPTSRLEILISRSLMHIADAFMVAVMSITIGIFAFGLDFTGVNMYMFALALITSMFAAIAFGTVVSSIGLVTRDIQMIMNIGILGLIIFTGANFAIEKLPAFVRWVPELLPVTRGIKAARLIYEGSAGSQVMSLIRAELALGIVYMVLGYFLYILFEWLARKHATLDLY